MINHVPSVLIGKSNGAANTGSTIPTLVAKDIIIINSLGAVLSGTPTPVSAVGNEKIQFIMGLGSGKVKKSNWIEAGKVRSYKKEDYAAAAAQVSYLGYNGTDGTINVENETEYAVRIVYKDQQRLIANRQTQSFQNYVSGVATDGFTIVSNLAKGLQSQAGTFVKVEVVTDGTITEYAEDVTLVKGSAEVVCAGDNSVAIGDFARFRGVDYKVVAVSGNDFTLDRPYTGDSETIDVSATTNLAGSLATIAKWGLKFTGVAIPTVYPNRYEFVAFSVAKPLGFDDTVEFRTSTTAFGGVGLPIQVKHLEENALGQAGFSNRRLWPVPDEPLYADLDIATGYDLITINSDMVYQDGINGQRQSPVSTVIAFYEGTSTQRNAFTTILDAWMVGAGVFEDATW